MNPADHHLDIPAILSATRDGQVLEPAAMEAFVAAISDGRADDAQVGAWLMAVRLSGLDASAGAALLASMADSGERLAFEGPVADKHSSGGVGDKVSFILAPLLATVGVQVPMISGRSLGHTGGTLDKLESISGVRVDFSPAELHTLLDSVGCFIAAASPQLAPADARLYALRDRTETIDSIPLIAASILSKKLAAGVSALVLDVKWGSAAFMTTRSAAEALASTMVEMATTAGMSVSAAVTPMNTPLGRSIGNAAEIAESLAVLRNETLPDPRLRDLSLALAAEAASLAGVDLAPGVLEKALSSGAALECFEAMCLAQGAHHPLDIATAAHHMAVPARHSGPGFFDAHRVALAASELGATRMRRAIDPAASIVLAVTDGESVSPGAPIAHVAGNDAGAVANAAELLAAAFVPLTEPWTPVETVTTWIRPIRAAVCS